MALTTLLDWGNFPVVPLEPEVKLPRYVMFKGDNDYYLRLSRVDDLWYLCFNSTARDLTGSHEIIPVPGKVNVVVVRALDNQRHWRRSSNWVYADHQPLPDAARDDCMFKVYQVSPTKVALQNLRNGLFVKRLTTEGKTSALNAGASDYSSDPTAQMEVSEAVSDRRIFDVVYLTNSMMTTEHKPLILASAKGTNQTRSKCDVAVTATYTETEVQSWKDSSTFKTGISVTVTAGVPKVSEGSLTVSQESTFQTEMGKENGKSKSISSTFTVKDVAPGVEVTIIVSGTEARARVPFKYNCQNTLLNGAVQPVVSAVDGIYTGVRVVDIKWLATDTGGNPQEVVVSKTTTSGPTLPGVKDLIKNKMF